MNESALDHKILDDCHGLNWHDMQLLNTLPQLAFWLNGHWMIDIPYHGASYWRNYSLAHAYATALWQILSSDKNNSREQLQLLGYYTCLALQDNKLRQILINLPRQIVKQTDLLLNCAFDLLFADNQAISATKDAYLLACIQTIQTSRAKQFFCDLLRILIARKQLAYLTNIMECYQTKCWQQYDICLAKVWSADTLITSQINLIKDCIFKRYHMQARLQCYVMPEMLGGIIIELCGRRIDNSFASILQRLQKFVERI